MVYFYKQYTQPTFQYSTPPLSDYSSTQIEKERHEGTFEDGCRMNNRWLACTIKKIYALVQVQIHNTHIHIQRGYVGRYIKGESVCMTEGYFKMTKCYLSSSVHGAIWQLFSFINATNVTSKNLFCCYKWLAKTLRQRHTHTHILGFLPASIDPFKTKEAPPDRKKEAGVFGQDYSPVRELSLGFQTPLSPPLAWSSLKRGRREKERD